MFFLHALYFCDVLCCDFFPVRYLISDFKFDCTSPSVSSIHIWQSHSDPQMQDISVNISSQFKVSAYSRTHSTTGFSAHGTQQMDFLFKCFRYTYAETPDLAMCAYMYAQTIIESRSISAYGRRHSTTGLSAHGTPLPDFLRMFPKFQVYARRNSRLVSVRTCAQS